MPVALCVICFYLFLFVITNLVLAYFENTEIKYSLPKSVNTASLYIYDMNGKQIDEIALAVRGEGSVIIQGNRLTAGMYLYSLIADGEVISVKRMILTK